MEACGSSLWPHRYTDFIWNWNMTGKLNHLLRAMRQLWVNLPILGLKIRPRKREKPNPRERPGSPEICGLLFSDGEGFEHFGADPFASARKKNFGSNTASLGGGKWGKMRYTWKENRVWKVCADQIGNSIFYSGYTENQDGEWAKLPHFQLNEYSSFAVIFCSSSTECITDRWAAD